MGPFASLTLRLWLNEQTRKIMLMIWMLFSISIVACHEVYESAEDIHPKYNITKLYPVANKTIDNNKNQINDNERDYERINIIEEDRDNQQKIVSNETFATNTLNTRNISKWSIDATYALPDETERNYSNSTNSKEETSVEKPKSKTEIKEFKPSPHLGSFFDDESLSLLKLSTSEPFTPTEKRPSFDFTRTKNLYVLDYKSPKDSYGDQPDIPYRFETNHFPETKNWKHTLESNPTVESPVKIPAGGLYKYSNPFKEKPGANGDDDDFGLGFNEGGKEKENPVKKRSNPWKGLLNLVTALLPVGLIISALTPNVITIHGTDNPHANRFSRRLDGSFAEIPPISEQCKRRLLCEIHSEENYTRSPEKSFRYARKHCYKIRCEDPLALNRVLRWLLAHRPAANHLHGSDHQLPGVYHSQSGYDIPYKVEPYSSDIMRHRSLKEGSFIK